MTRLLLTICLLLSPVAFADYDTLLSDGNLQAHYACEDNAASATVANSAGTDGSIVTGGPNTSDISTTGPTAWQSLAFDVSDERIGFGDALEFTGSFTVAFWANRDVTSANHSVVTSLAADRIAFWSGTTELRVVIDGTPYVLAVSDTDNWHHYVVIYRASDDTIDLIVDGVETDVDNAGPSSLTWTINRFAVTSASTDYFDGQLSDIFIFDRDLSLAEAQDLYNGPSTGPSIPLIHYYRQMMSR
jgi:hypothetical protein